MKDELKYHNELNETEPSTRNLFMIEKAARQKVFSFSYVRHIKIIKIDISFIVGGTAIEFE